MKRNSLWWISALMGFAAFLVVGIGDGWLHSRWYNWKDGGWGDWAYQQGEVKYYYYQQLYYNSVYIITGIIAGGIAGAGPVEHSRRSLRFVIGPFLMGIAWFLFPADVSSSARHLLVFSRVATFVFFASAFSYGRLFGSYLANTRVERNPNQEGIWPPPPQEPRSS